MPIYEYNCDQCGTFELSQRITDKPLRRCPTCKGKVRKLISNTSFQLKGSGWYVSDYAGKDGGGKKGKPESPAEPAAVKESKDSPAAGDSKPASKAEVTAA
ncbi:MAG: zinc ribbon domain-containing protein [Deltaproteobacteria bacterium]|nr:zinc ribbon domain-containing protein [Deltaproteobacteria bacterium]